ncbi:hypothetical protein [Cerasicoccus frondis]|uniref:hypothetical protein n=1 Tax=Cerasicoccus frondis TaxID=490090 RepID=UPI0028529394|nr:hypothetical protein [Cerasicoccus frondis]
MRCDYFGAGAGSQVWRGQEDGDGVWLNVMARVAQYLGLLVALLAALYFGAFLVLGHMASRYPAVNRFYSDFYYPMREWKERRYLDAVSTYRGQFYLGEEFGKGSISTGPGKGVGFLVPDELVDKVYSIEEQSTVEVEIGMQLDRETIGVYHYELRAIRVMSGPAGQKAAPGA